MILGKHVLEDLDVASLDVGTQTPWGKTHFQQGFQTPSSSPSQLRRRQLPLLLFRRRANQPLRDSIHHRIQTVLAPLSAVLEDAVSTTRDTRVDEGIQQIYWSKESYGKCLNTQHLLLTALLVWKTLVIPGLSVVAPLLAVIMPFLLLRFVHGNTSVTLWEYGSHVKRTLLQHVNVPSMLRAKHEGDMFGKILETLFLGLTFATFATSLWNQIQAALHLRSIAADIRRRGEAIQQAVACIQSILKDLHAMSPENRFGLRHFLTEGERVLGAFESTMTDAARPLAIYGFVWNDPDTLRQLLSWLGKLDVWIAISRLESICTPRFMTGEHPLDIEALHHPNIVAEKRVLNTVQFQTHPHVLLTGPNRGGKSTFCKSVGLAILMAQTWGFAWAKRMSYTPYTVMVTALRPTDTLGRLSLFESEIEFARDVLEQCSGNSAGGRVFVMMDEIFHSTNAHDGFEATRIFLRKLYDAGGHVTSMISTHYRGLTDVFQADVQPWAMEAHDDAEGNIRYTYRVIPGVSEKSSVMEILKERGLL